MTKYFSRCHAAIGATHHHTKQLVAGLIHVHLTANQTGNINVKMLFHGPQRTRIGTELDDRKNRITDDISLTSRKEMHDKSGSGTQGNLFRSSGRGILEPETRAGGCDCFFKATYNRSFPADLLDVGPGLFLRWWSGHLRYYPW